MRARWTAALPLILISVFGTGLTGQKAAAPAAGLSPGQAKGTLVVNGKSVTLRYAYADLEPNPFDESKHDIVVVLTDRPIPAAILAKEDIGGLPGAADAASVPNYLRIKLRREDKAWEIGHRTITHEALKGKSLQISPDPVSRIDARTISEARVDAIVYTDGPQTFPHDDTHEFKVSFSATVMPLKAPAAPPPSAKRPGAARKGTPLPADGGEPGRVYLAHNEALLKSDLETLRKTDATIAEASASQLEDLRNLLPLIAAAAATGVKIIRGWVDGDDAVLELEGVVMGQKQKGEAVMVRSGGTWKVVEVDWN